MYGIWLHAGCANGARLHRYVTRLRLPSIGIDLEACSSSLAQTTGQLLHIIVCFSKDRSSASTLSRHISGISASLILFAVILPSPTHTLVLSEIFSRSSLSYSSPLPVPSCPPNHPLTPPSNPPSPTPPSAANPACTHTTTSSAQPGNSSLWCPSTSSLSTSTVCRDRWGMWIMLAWRSWA